MLWTEKYRPTNISQVMGQQHFTMDAQSWIDEKEMPNVLIYGQSGNGKTTAGIILGREMLGEHFADNFFEINASDDRKLETVRNTIKEVARSASIGPVPFRMCMLDEMDGMTTDAQNALKRIMERYASNIRFIITCNDRNKIIFALQSRCANYHFKPLGNDDMMYVIANILSKEGVVKFSTRELETFLYAMNGDMRRAITEIQAAKASNSTLTKQVEHTLDDYKNIIDRILNKNTNVLGEIHDLLYKGRSIKEICSGLHDVVVSASGLDSNVKFKFLRTIGEAEWRSTTMTPKVLASWMVSQLM